MLAHQTSRRDFLKGTGLLIVSFSIARVAPTFAQGGTGAKTVAPDELDAFLSIDPRGGVTVYYGKVDLGTGVRTAITQIVAEELDVPLLRVEVVEGDTALTPDQGPTYGSLSIQNGGVQIRQAAATARRALMQEASRQLGVPAGELMVVDGTVRSRTGDKQVTYGELIGGKTFALKVDKQAPLKDPASYKIVGQSVARLDIPAKVTGQFTYMQDFQVPGTLHGRVVRPPAIGATLLSGQEGSVKGIAGLVKVGRNGNFLGAVVEIREGKLTCWSASQATHNLRKQLAAMLSIPESDVRAMYIEGSGCYGRNGHEDAAADAALLARAVERPVRVQWMRADEHGWDPKGPPTLVDLQAGLDPNGHVVAWYSQFFIPEGAAGNVKLVAAELAGLPHETSMSPGNIIQNSAIPYAFPNVRTVAHRLAETPPRPAWPRTPGRMQNTFANEAFMDELAAAAGADPLEFRLRYLNDPRGVELLKRLARFPRWEGHPSPKRQSGHVATGRGVSYVKYELTRTYVGAVATVEVNRKSGELRVKHFAVVQDCGLIINPDGVKNQVEGNVVQTVSRTLREEVTFDRSAVTSLDWASYPILTFSEIPDVDIELIGRPTEKPLGGGEPATAVVPSAIANAVFDAVGVRLRSVPFTPAKVRAAIQGA